MVDSFTSHRLIFHLRRLLFPSIFLWCSVTLPYLPSPAGASGRDLQEGARLYNEGRFVEALPFFESALEDDPSSAAVTRNLATTLNALGQKRYVAGDFERAAEYLERAVEHLPEEPEIHLLLAAIYFRQGELYEARRAADEVLSLREGHPQAHELLGDISYQEGYLTRAVPEWEAALEKAGPHAARLRAKIERAERESDAESSFSREVSVHFTLQYDDTVPDGIATAILEEMEQAYDMIGAELGEYPEGDIPVILYSKVVFTEITRNPLWVAGSFDGKIRVPVRGLTSGRDVHRLRPILTHELAHAFIQQMAPQGLPLWFQEGLAKHFEGFATEHAYSYLERNAGGFPRSLDGLNAGLRGQSGTVQASYLASLLALRTLIDEEGFWSVRTILESVGSGVPFSTAFSEETRLTLTEFQERWAASLP
jgi:tetratricopeptide (TPR) repeat protein